MLFTILTPSFNCGDCLLDNLRSIREQGFPPGQLEQWVIDGGSTDGTVELLKQQPDIKWVSERDKGLSDAVNKGIQRAQGDWIVWLNADDLLAKGALRTFLEYAHQYPQHRLFVGDLVFLKYDGSVEQEAKARAYTLEGLLGMQTGINQQSTIIHREVFQRVGLIDTTIRYAMDYEWMVRAVKHYEVIPIPHVLAFYRRRRGSIMDAHMPAHYREFLRQRRKHGKPYWERAEWRIRFYIYSDWLRRIHWLRRGVRRVKRVFGKEPLHPM